MPKVPAPSTSWSQVIRCSGLALVRVGRPSSAGSWIDVAHLVAAAAQRREAAHLAAGPQVRAVVRRGREVGVVEGVLRPVVAADVALAAQPAGRARPAVQVAVGRRRDRRAGHRRVLRTSGEASPPAAAAASPGRAARRCRACAAVLAGA